MRSDRNNNFDILRLLAALSVAVFHGMIHFKLAEASPAWRAFSSFISRFPGVPIFFCISGFLIAKSAERNLDSLGKYFRARVLRIYPALWACVALGGLAIWRFGFFDHVPAWRIALWCATNFLAGGAALNPSFLRSFGTGVWNASLWTIFVELSFYVFLPATYLACRKIGFSVNRAFCWCLALSFAVFISAHGLEYGETKAVGGLSKMVWYSLPGNLWMFLFGTLAHCYWSRLAPWFEGKAGWWILAGVVLPQLLWPLSFPGAFGFVFAVLRLFLLRLCVAGLTLSVAFSFTGVSSRLLRGQDISYGLYLYHMFVFNVLIQLGFRGLKGFSLGLLVSLALGAASWFLLERRALALKEPSLARRAAAAIPSTPGGS